MKLFFTIAILNILMHVNLFHNLESDVMLKEQELSAKLVKEQTKADSTLIPFLGKNGKYGFSNESGELVIPIQYDSVEVFNPLGYSKVYKGSKEILINKTGIILYSLEKANAECEIKLYLPRFSNQERFYILYNNCNNNFEVISRITNDILINNPVLIDSSLNNMKEWFLKIPGLTYYFTKNNWVFFPTKSNSFQVIDNKGKLIFKNILDIKYVSNEVFGLVTGDRKAYLLNTYHNWIYEMDTTISNDYPFENKSISSIFSNLNCQNLDESEKEICTCYYGDNLDSCFNLIGDKRESKLDSLLVNREYKGYYIVLNDNRKGSIYNSQFKKITTKYFDRWYGGILENDLMLYDNTAKTIDWVVLENDTLTVIETFLNDSKQVDQYRDELIISDSLLIYSDDKINIQRKNIADISVVRKIGNSRYYLQKFGKDEFLYSFKNGRILDLPIKNYLDIGNGFLSILDKNENNAIIDTTGKIVIPFTKDKIRYDSSFDLFVQNSETEFFVKGRSNNVIKRFPKSSKNQSLPYYKIIKLIYPNYRKEHTINNIHFLRSENSDSLIIVSSLDNDNEQIPIDAYSIISSESIAFNRDSSFCYTSTEKINPVCIDHEILSYPYVNASVIITKGIGPKEGLHYLYNSKLEKLKGELKFDELNFFKYPMLPVLIEYSTVGNDKKGLMNLDGEQVLKVEYSSVKYSDGIDSPNIFYDDEKNESEIFNGIFQHVTTLPFKVIEYVHPNENTEYVIFEENGLQGLYDMNKGLVEEAIYSNILWLGNDFFLLKTDYSKVLLINTKSAEFLKGSNTEDFVFKCYSNNSFQRHRNSEINIRINERGFLIDSCPSGFGDYQKQELPYLHSITIDGKEVFILNGKLLKE